MYKYYNSCNIEDVFSLQNVEDGRQVRQGRYPVLTTLTFTQAPVAVLGCSRLQWATL